MRRYYSVRKVRVVMECICWRGQTVVYCSNYNEMYFVLGGKKEIAIKMDEDQLQILDDLPSSAVELQVKDKV